MDGLDQLRPELSTGSTDAEKPARVRRLFCVALGTVVLLAGCKPGEGKAAAGTVDTTQSPGHVDSIVPMDEALRRFREDVPVAPRLEGGASSRDELVERFMRAIQANDTASVRQMLVSQAEYAYLYFPTSSYMNKPYELAPALAWFLNVQNSEKGITRVMRRLGGHDLAFKGYTCAEEAAEGENSFWRSCTVTYRDPLSESQVTRRIFGAIMERNGRHKFLSYANDF